MQYVSLGKSGLQVSRICLGTMGYGDPHWREWTLDEATARPIVCHAIEQGVNFFDTANLYSRGKTENFIGKVLREQLRRDQYVIATKAYFPTGDSPNERGLSRKHLFAAVEASLKRLGVDYIDLFYIHRWDYSTPIEETLRALDDLVRAGKICYLGASSMYAWQFAKSLYLADKNLWTRFVAMQNHYNLIYREEEREMIPLCKEEGVAIVPWAPLARGFLTGSRSRKGGGETVRAKTDDFLHQLYYAESDFQVVEDVVALAHKRGIAPAEVALAWLLRKGVAAFVLGPSKITHLDAAIRALTTVLTDQEVEELERHYQPHPVLGHSPYGVNLYYTR